MRVHTHDIKTIFAILILTIDSLIHLKLICSDNINNS